MREALRATLAVPGDLATPTGGYAYARRLLAEAPAAGLALAHLELPAGFPFAAAAALEEAARRLGGLPQGAPILIDGLALGVLPPALLATLPGPVVALCHHPLAEETGLDAEEAHRLRESERAAFGGCRQVIATSGTTARTLARDYGVSEARLTVARPGTDSVPAARGSGGPGVALLAVGSLTPRKGHDVLIAALAGLVHLEWRLTIAGSPDLDPAHAAALRALAEGRALAGRVDFAGALGGPDLEAAYARADLFVLASRHEGFGMAYREAMARGLPVVGTTAGAISEATLGAARLVPPNDVRALRAALAELITAPAARADLARRCREAAARFERWPETAAAVARALARAAA